MAQSVFFFVEGSNVGCGMHRILSICSALHANHFFFSKHALAIKTNSIVELHEKTIVHEHQGKDLFWFLWALS